MSKADQMGESAAFGRVGNPRSARGRSKEQAFNNAGPTVLALHLLSRNPDNPREEMLELDDLASSLRDHGQKQALAIMTRGAYLDANPGRDGELEPHTEYVTIDGNRRLTAARMAGLKSLKVTLDDEGLGTDSNEILESALVANVFNQKLEPLDEAKALKTLLEIHGTQEALAARLHRSQGWVSQRLSLLDLKPELQERLKAGKESASHLRRVGKKPVEEQDKALAAIKAKEAREKEERAARARAKAQTKEQAAAEPKGTPDSRSLPDSGDPDDPGSTAVEPYSPDTARPSKPGPPKEEGAQAGLRDRAGEADEVVTQGLQGKVESMHVDWLPLERPELLARMLQERMSPSSFAQMVKVAQTLI
ncbi:ParB/RepB/Spo0J family partition protein [Streptomyces sp. NPDC048611]|uniref:ParB/RepB/Spo0J family partition protein n=1 Tax=Streptomyces sp. NPDC048611 TaxID=3155635 RepID=UPI003424A2AB